MGDMRLLYQKNELTVQKPKLAGSSSSNNVLLFCSDSCFF